MPQAANEPPKLGNNTLQCDSLTPQQWYLPASGLSKDAVRCACSNADESRAVLRRSTSNDVEVGEAHAPLSRSEVLKLFDLESSPLT